MPGSSFSIAEPNIVLNTIVADALADFADELERAESFDYAAMRLIRRTIREHRRIVFNGNNYTDAWVEEAGRRGLLNLTNAVDALARLADAPNEALFARHGVYNGAELRSRQEILLEEYAKEIRIEALTMLDMVRRSILPVLAEGTRRLAEGASLKRGLGVADAYESRALEQPGALMTQISDAARGARPRRGADARRDDARPRGLLPRRGARADARAARAGGRGGAARGRPRVAVPDLCGDAVQRPVTAGGRGEERL